MEKRAIVYALTEIEELLRHGALDQAGVAAATQKVQALREAMTGEGMPPEPPVPEDTEPAEPEPGMVPEPEGPADPEEPPAAG